MFKTWWSGSYSKEQRQSAEKAAEVLRVVSTASKDKHGARGIKRKADDEPSPTQSPSEPIAPADVRTKPLSRPKKAVPASDRPSKGVDVFQVEDDQAVSPMRKSTVQSGAASRTKAAAMQANKRTAESKDSEHPEDEQPRPEDSPSQSTRRTRQAQAMDDHSDHISRRTRTKQAKKSDKDKGVDGNREPLDEEKSAKEDGRARASRGLPREKRRRTETHGADEDVRTRSSRVNEQPAEGIIVVSRAPAAGTGGKSGEWGHSEDVDPAEHGAGEDQQGDEAAENNEQAYGVGGVIISDAWELFNQHLSKIQKKRAEDDTRAVRGRDERIKELLRMQELAVDAYNTLEEAADLSSPLALKADRDIEDFLATLARIGESLTSGQARNARQEKQLVTDIYREIIPELSTLLIEASQSNRSRFGADISTWSVSSLTELVRLMDLIALLCEKATSWPNMPKLPGFFRPTQSLKASTLVLRKLHKDVRDAKNQHEKAYRRAKRRSAANAAYKIRLEREEREHSEKCERRWDEIMADLKETGLMLPHGRRYAAANGEMREFADATPSPVEIGRSFGSPELGEDHDPRLRTPMTPLTGKSQRTTVPRDLPRRALTFGSGEQREWGVEEERALLDGLQEHQGPSRYYDIFNAYSGRQLAGRDMDAIKRKARSLKAALINDLRGSDNYEDFGFLWSVAD